jgi:LytS/YehU family sensor histidine kinase
VNANLRVIIVFFVWCTLFALVQFWLLLDFNCNIYFKLYDSLISHFIIAFISCGLYFISKNLNPNYSRLFQPLAILVIGIGFSYLLQKFIISIVVEDSAYNLFVTQTSKLRLVFNTLLIISATLIGFVWNYKSNKQIEQQRLNDNEQLHKEAELLNLRQQIQPHFLFNSLNSISALLILNPNMAQKMIQELADFLRGTLKKDASALVTLKSEINHLQLYLNIEKVRFEHRLTTVFDIDKNTEELLLPSLLIQPIVENAIKFGLYGTTEKITLYITVKSHLDMLMVKITNPFDKDAMTQNRGVGFGLNSISRRLYLLYGRHDLLKINKEENTFTTQILIPQKCQLK